jgi:hypothetical protein
MKLAHRTDFLFIGFAVLSAVFIVAGWLPALFLVSVPLLIVACLHGMYEQKVDEIEQSRRPSSESGAQSTAATKIVLERRDGREG